MSKSAFLAKDYTMDQMNALVKQIGGIKTVEGILNGTLEFQVIKPEKRWIEKDGIIYLTLAPSDGTTGTEWINRLKDNGHKVPGYEEYLLKSDDFKPTTGVTYNLAIIKGEKFEDSIRTAENVRAFASKKSFARPDAEVACLIREQISNEELEEMGLMWIVVMHEPINDSDGVPLLLSPNRRGGSWLSACWDSSDSQWRRGLGFAFVASQVSA